MNLVRARAWALRNAYSSETTSRTTSIGRVTKGRVGLVHTWARRPSGSFQSDHHPGSAGRNSKPASGARAAPSSRSGIVMTQEERRSSPSVITSRPAASWSAMASRTARSSAARSASARDAPLARALPRLPEIGRAEKTAHHVGPRRRHAEGVASSGSDTGTAGRRATRRARAFAAPIAINR